MALAAIPPAVPFHSIIDQKIAGQYNAGTDGVVAYASSHLDGAESETIIPFGHELSSTRTLLPRSSEYFTFTLRPCKRRSAFGLQAALVKHFREKHMETLSRSLALMARDPIVSPGKAPGEFGCPEDRELKARLIGAGM
jgi:hypothetical protein